MNKEKFVARTRKRGEISYHTARWEKNKKGLYKVTFLDGPHKGETYSAINTAIASKQWR